MKQLHRICLPKHVEFHNALAGYWRQCLATHGGELGSTSECTWSGGPVRFPLNNIAHLNLTYNRYAGFMRSKWAINSAFMAFYAFAATLITWVLWAYKIGFGIYMLPFAGRPGPVVTIAQELKQSELPSAGLQQNFPLSTMIYFQFVFAAITVVIMAGAFLGRMNFTAWMLFVPLWITFSYTIGAYSLWGGGFLFQRGVIDYSGGYVIHLSSGTAGFVGAHVSNPFFVVSLSPCCVGACFIFSALVRVTRNIVLICCSGLGHVWMSTA